MKICEALLIESLRVRRAGRSRIVNFADAFFERGWFLEDGARHPADFFVMAGVLRKGGEAENGD